MNDLETKPSSPFTQTPTLSIVIMADPPRGYSSIGCENFKSGVDDFDEWVELFEYAVELATNLTDEALKTQYKKWLPLKLDKTALAVFRQCDATVGWDLLKATLKNLLVDPTEQYKWQSNRATVKWNGTESFQALASRVVRAVNKFDKDLPEAVKARECFFRFRDSLPKPFRDAIGMGCAENTRTLERIWH